MNKYLLPITIDCHYIRPRFAASFLIREDRVGVFVENNTAHSVPFLLESLKQNGLSTQEVKYIIVTHVHLDHAGGTYALMKACPKATLLAHPKASKHLIDPTKLISSAKNVYGEKQFEKLYGEIAPVEASRVHSVEDGEEFKIGSRTLKFFNTKGHANHHVCIYDSGSNGVFTGDSFGLAYPDLQPQLKEKKMFIFPSTSPTDFDPEEAKLSVEKIRNTGAERAYLTHFGEIRDLESASRQLIRYLDFSQKLINEIQNCEIHELEQKQSYCEEKITEYLFSELGIDQKIASQEMMEILKLDIELNASGLIYSIRRKKEKQNG